MISIVIPCYNEGGKLIENINKIIKYMENNIDDTYEIICINDGSTDNTKLLMKSNYNNFKNIVFVGYDKNKGKGFAVKTGMQIAIGEKILFMDADLSVDLSAIKVAINQEYDIVIGSRNLKESEISNKTITRKVFSKVSNTIIKLFMKLDITDTQCGFKLFKRNIAEILTDNQKINRWAFDVEYLLLAKENNFSIKEIPVKWNNDKDSRVRLVRDTISFMTELKKIKKQ